MNTSVTTIKPLLQHIKNKQITKNDIHCIILTAQLYDLYTDIKDWRLIDEKPFSDTLQEIINLLNIPTLPPEQQINYPQEFIQLIQKTPTEKICKIAQLIYNTLYNKKQTNKKQIQKIKQQIQKQHFNTHESKQPYNY